MPHGFEEAETPEEITRRQWMAKATVAISGVIGLTLAIPIIGSLNPDVGAGGAVWTGLDENGWKQLQTATDKAVHIDINLKSKDAYLPEEASPQSVWGIKVKDPQKFMKDRKDLFTPAGKNMLPYPIVTLGFVLFSPICPHLGCYYNYDAANNKFACPCHGSQFDAVGGLTHGPAARGLDPLPLREQSGVAQIEWIRYAPTIPDRLVVSYTA
ncbi:MAG TPA: ubiquinol-cytochrome c reductase iron-sulfur subunit [Candidatus Rubrimentiphilum sp.]|nr:ubiquinol-cytochrome c reductase iron-sulfur subunit [Candidatus Rubrimentiphilum sp.]